jgi:hypothetical protein
MTKRYFVVYKDRDQALYSGDAWVAYSFATPGERDRMIHDLNSSNSLWSGEAVQMFTFERDMIGYEGENQNDNTDTA